ncbi:uncharacterized protein MONBRDRAFT_9491 [Monosiga brevicollis MX1]|uniref:RING-type E3 ubiquitin transferase n=1 Tax=Monosiga brevicollis TaxID=81824 RepID=A9V3B5_MONBE|nr:uncharacterized protein MONBRDRAFT_9491 [Monosiga brevicollis MX1]EDQ88031.1 predicted protein [Monosiga brevicollis MX1]|eukprot:XP_001747107.1 hypothetical protein [Monosiga brevicollis MX1]
MVESLEELKHSPACQPKEYVKSTFSVENLTCNICLELATKPYQCASCQALFGGPCLAMALETRDTCPSCRATMMPIASGILLNRALVQIASEITMCCPHTEHGCSAVIRVTEVDDHLANNCTMRVEKCPHAGCDFSGVAQEVAKHKKSCKYRWLKCPNGCRADDLTEDTLKRHLDALCPEMLVYCPEGCGARLRRRDFLEHSCPSHLVSRLQQLEEDVIFLMRQAQTARDEQQQAEAALQRSAATNRELRRRMARLKANHSLKNAKQTLEVMRKQIRKGDADAAVGFFQVVQRNLLPQEQDASLLKEANGYLARAAGIGHPLALVTIGHKLRRVTQLVNNDVAVGRFGAFLDLDNFLSQFVKHVARPHYHRLLQQYLAVVDSLHGTAATHRSGTGGSSAQKASATLRAGPDDNGQARKRAKRVSSDGRVASVEPNAGPAAQDVIGSAPWDNVPVTGAAQPEVKATTSQKAGVALLTDRDLRAMRTMRVVLEQLAVHRRAGTSSRLDFVKQLKLKIDILEAQLRLASNTAHAWIEDTSLAARPLADTLRHVLGNLAQLLDAEGTHRGDWSKFMLASTVAPRPIPLLRDLWHAGNQEAAVDMLSQHMGRSVPPELYMSLGTPGHVAMLTDYENGEYDDLEVLETLAYRGHERAMTQLGVDHLEGAHVTAALHWGQMAASQGDPRGMAIYADSLFKFMHSPREEDRRRVEYWSRMAFEADNADLYICYIRAKVLLGGIGIERDLVQGRELLQQVAAPPSNRLQTRANARLAALDRNRVPDYDTDDDDDVMDAVAREEDEEYDDDYDSLEEEVHGQMSSESDTHDDDFA